MESVGRIYFYALPIVILAALAEGLVLARAGRAAYDWRAFLCSVADAVGRRLLGFVPIGLATPVFALAYEHRVATIDLDGPLAMLGLFVGLEFFYYWYHRVSHRVRWFWATHAVHHSPNELNLSAAFRLGWTGRITGVTIFFTPLALLGFHPAAVLTAFALNLLYQFWLHATWIPRLGWLEFVFNTPSHHRVHHARNLAYLDANYGGVLIVFDRLFGTFVAERETEPCDYGLITRVTSYNPVYIAFHAWIDLGRDLLAARSLREVTGYLFGPPGWRPDGRGLTTRNLRQAAVTPMPAE
ncbi:MAG: sterol desaturase family protein [Alphaproteobacteria bacterium]|nr:sterol desaturase family protein [Alphaproteobacteria bacterium]